MDCPGGKWKTFKGLGQVCHAPGYPTAPGQGYKGVCVCVGESESECERARDLGVESIQSHRVAGVEIQLGQPVRHVGDCVCVCVCFCA